MATLSVPVNPTASVPLDFTRYVQEKDSRFDRHKINGVPDYAFSMDLQLRGRLNAMGPVRNLCKSMLSMIVPAIKQTMAMQCVAVSPTQYPEIYKMGEECARILGIGVPQIYIKRSHEMNAFAMAVDDNASVIVLHSELIEHTTEAELMFIIGHECGHLHNLHGVYNTIGNILLNASANALLQVAAGAGGLPINLLATILKFGTMALLNSWSRCAEITCDRAGFICCKDAQACQSALSKLAGGMGSTNLEELRAQVSTIKRSILRFQEWQASHPLIPKRLEAIHLFEQCQTLYDWHPDLRGTRQTLSKEEVDRRCEQLVSLSDQDYQLDKN